MFRGWTKCGFVYFDVREDNDFAFYDFYSSCDENTIEQYTELKDKNGKEIYEGDVVKYKLYVDSRLNYVDEVFYDTTSGAFMVGDKDNIRTLDCLINIEVIGNIHESPELLEGEEK